MAGSHGQLYRRLLLMYEGTLRMLLPFHAYLLLTDKDIESSAFELCNTK